MFVNYIKSVNNLTPKLNHVSKKAQGKMAFKRTDEIPTSYWLSILSLTAMTYVSIILFG